MSAPIELAAGSHLFRAGDAADLAYLVEDGQIEIWVGSEDAPQRVALIGSNGLVGEMAMLDGAPRSANARAVVPTRLLPIGRVTLEERLNDADPMVKLVTTVILSRMRRMLQAEDSAQTVETRNAAIDDLKLESQLANAIRNSGLRLNYQPIVSLTTGTIAGFEALARWPHADGRLIPPMQFIPVAESSGLVTELTRWAIGQAAADLIAFNEAHDRLNSGSAPIFMSVNASGRDLGIDGFDNEVIAIWRSFGHDPSSLKIEVTESMMMRNPEQARGALERLRDAGFRISIDDFGTGHSSLAYLSQLPIDTLKIDRSFVTDTDTNEMKARMIRSILGIANALGLDTIAEGIESEAECFALAAVGTSYGQGYLFSRPVPVDRAIDLYMRWVPRSWHASPISHLTHA
jgi:EAL domain-containing protein (putative c-di-GMP-specific phosphodiesterase class I)